MLKKIVDKIKEVYSIKKQYPLSKDREMQLIKEIQQLRKEKSDLYEQIQRFENEGGYTKKSD